MGTLEIIPWGLVAIRSSPWGRSRAGSGEESRSIWGEDALTPVLPWGFVAQSYNILQISSDSEREVGLQEGTARWINLFAKTQTQLARGELPQPR